MISKLKFLVVGIYFMLEKRRQQLLPNHNIKISHRERGIYKNLHRMDCSARRVTRRSSRSKAFMIDRSSITLRLPPVINIIPSHLEKSQWIVIYKIHNDCDFPHVLNEHRWSRWCERRWCVRSLHSQFPWRSRWLVHL